MKKPFIILCLILALLLSVGSISLSLSMKSVKDDTPKVEESLSETEPVLKTFVLHGHGYTDYIEGFNTYPKIFYFEEGMTWSEFCDSEYNIDNFFTISDDCVEVDHMLLFLKNSPVDYIVVNPSDVIDTAVYSIEC